MGIGSEVRTAIDAANAEFVRLFNSGDIAGVATKYTADAKFLAPGHDTFTGREAIGAVLEALRGDGNTLELQTDDLESEGAHAWETGRFRVIARTGEEAENGKYVVVWKNDGGEWRLHRDIINSSRPR